MTIEYPRAKAEGRESAFPPDLQGGLWHTTHPDRYEAILQCEAILPDPPLPDEERWKTSRGPYYYPYTRIIGGVSLFDFYEFDPEAYSSAYPMSNWREFVPYRWAWGVAIWIDIDRREVADNFVTAAEIVEQWKARGALQHTIMPHIEAAYLGAVPISAFRRALIFSSDAPGFREVPIVKQSGG